MSRSQKKRRRILITAMVIVIAILTVADVGYVLYWSPEAQMNAKAEAIWRATPPPEPPTFAILSKIGDQSPEGGRLLYGGVAGIWNRSNHDIIVNLEFLQSAAILNSGCPMTIELTDFQKEILVITGGQFIIGSSDNERLNAGLFAACYASRFDPAERQVAAAEGLGIYQMSMLVRKPYADYKDVMGQFKNPFVVTKHYKWMLKSMTDVGLTGLPLKIITP